MTLYLLPNLLSETANLELSLPSGEGAIVEKLDGLIAEDAKQGRAFLKRLLSQRKVADVPLALLNEHTRDEELEALLQPLLRGQTWGIVSDAGLPCLADPGARLVARARRLRIVIRALPGPCSFVLALMLSGLPAQRFAFHGYLPRDAQELATALHLLQQRAKREGETQVFIETPYRNQRLLQNLLQHLDGDIVLSVACDLTSENEEVSTQTVKEWKARPLLALKALDDRPAVFLFASIAESPRRL